MKIEANLINIFFATHRHHLSAIDGIENTSIMLQASVMATTAAATTMGRRSGRRQH